jgi:hypothetical protein
MKKGGLTLILKPGIPAVSTRAVRYSRANAARSAEVDESGEGPGALANDTR